MGADAALVFTAPKIDVAPLVFVIPLVNVIDEEALLPSVTPPVLENVVALEIVPPALKATA